MTTDVQEAKKNSYIKWDRILTVNILTRFDYSLNDKTCANCLFNCILILAMLVLNEFYCIFVIKIDRFCYVNCLFYIGSVTK